MRDEVEGHDTTVFHLDLGREKKTWRQSSEKQLRRRNRGKMLKEVDKELFTMRMVRLETLFTIYLGSVIDKTTQMMLKQQKRFHRSKVCHSSTASSYYGLSSQWELALRWVTPSTLSDQLCRKANSLV
jgi:hypothetical protein